MNRVVTIMLLAIAFETAGASSLKTIFGEMPYEVVPYLSRNNKLDMVDFMESGMRAVITNAFGSKSEMTELTDSFASIRLSEAVVMQIRLLDYDGQHRISELKNDSVLAVAFNSGCVICVVTTYGRQPFASKVEFYNVEWERMNNIPNPMETIEKRDLMPDENFPEEYIMVVASLTAENSDITLEPKMPLASMDEKVVFDGKKALRILKWGGCSYKNN